jgi:dTDP-4-amino-4,6-dideoxygalactose transaminase
MSSPISAVADGTSAGLLFPFLDLKAQFATIRTDVLDAVQRLLEKQQFILGPEVERLEARIAQLASCRFGVGCASGSDALVLALMALEISRDDEVITSPFTFGATAGSIARVGARVVFADIDPGTYNLDVRAVQAAISTRTRAIMPVHLFGLPAEMDATMNAAARHRLAVIEDAAQAIAAEHRGRVVGGIGDVGCFSFFPSKNLGAAGDGGMLTTNEPAIAERLKLLRVHGMPRRYEYEVIGMNSRLDALQAVILAAKLEHLDHWTADRRRNATRYREMFSTRGLEEHVTLPNESAHSKHVYNQFVIRTRSRDGLREHLRRNGIPSEIYYPFPLHLQPAFAHLGYREGDFPEAESACREVLALPIFPELTEEQQQAVVHGIQKFFSRRNHE